MTPLLLPSSPAAAFNSVKNITFKDLGVVIDITKPLAVQRVAFRAIHQQYDDAASRAKLVRERARAFEGMAEAEAAPARPGTRAARGGRAAKELAAAAAAAADEAKGEEGDTGAVPRDVSLVRVVHVLRLKHCPL